MINGKKLVIVLPAYNAALTLKKTYLEIPFDIVDEVSDETVRIGHELVISHIIRHDRNRGYGGNQKTCYNKALEIGGDIVIMLHPDYQYTPKLIPSMAYLIANQVYQVVLGSRTLGKGALSGGMPLYKYIANRALTFFQNVLLRQKVAEDFVFDNEMLSQIIYLGYEIAEITCPTKYFDEASSINLRRSITYGLGVLRVSVVHRLCKWGVMKRKMYDPLTVQND